MKMPELSIVLPCRNEEKSLDYCLKQIKEVINKNKINAEIVVSDSSVDKSPDSAKKHQAHLVKHDKEGYGIACLEGFRAAKGKYIFFADCDSTYDFKEIPKFLKYLKEGYDLVIGNRFKGRIEKGAMPWSHRYIGSPVLSFLFRMFFKSKINDINSGMRAVSKNALEKLNLKTTGMEFASEMLIKASKKGLKTKEIPIDYYKREGDSKLRTMRDGWRHLRFMLLYSPLFLFLIPGAVLSILGLVSMGLLYLNKLAMIGIKFDYHPMFLSALLIIIGYQLVIFAFFAKTYSMIHFEENNYLVKWLNSHITIEKAGILGIFVILAGIIVYAAIFYRWINQGFGEMQEVKNSIIALTFITIGLQTVFSSFMLSILGIKEK
jgi:glycosyltransferase involved in cell wall biosynthesis